MNKASTLYLYVLFIFGDGGRNANPFVLFQVPKGRDFNKAQTEIMATRLSIAWTWSTQS